MNAIQAFPLPDRAKCAVTTEDFALPSEWYRHGTQLRGTLKLRGLAYLVEVETGFAGGEIDEAATCVGVFNAANRYVPPVDELVRVYALLLDAAKVEVARREVELEEANAELRAEERADDAMFEEAGA